MAGHRDCPKHMVHGPCGGVRPDGGCEMRPGPCVFDELPPWTGPIRTPSAFAAPLVLADFSAPSYDLPHARRIAAALAASVDAVLVGEHQNRPDYPPTIIARTLLDAGVQPWLTLACRDRNRIVLEQELMGLREVGVPAVLCVTGDGRGYDVRPDVTQVFDLDGPRLAELAASLGLAAAVAETPSAPPRELRPRRLLHKQHAGACVAVLNHTVAPGDVEAFVGAARRIGVVIPLLAAVAVYTDPESAAVLTGLPGLEVDSASRDAVLAAPDPVAAGIETAVAEARALLRIDGITGVNLSGAGSAVSRIAGAEIKAEVARRLRAEAVPS